MKKTILIILVFYLHWLDAQNLPPAAQALYNEFYNSDVLRGQYAVNNGAQAMATADGNSFYLKWIPTGATASLTPMLVTLHGSSGNAFNEFYLWHQRAQAKGVGIIALQWYRGAASVQPNDYFDDNTLYTYIDTALARIKYPSQRVFLHGFSRGSARSYALAFKDVQPGGKNYFCTILSNSGKADSAYPLYVQINAGNYGHSFYAGKKWAMFCGGQDPNPADSGCPGMSGAKSWVTANGGSVGLYISDPNLGHGGFHQTTAYIDSSLNYYLQCYATKTSIQERQKNSTVHVFPNPANNLVLITGGDFLSDDLSVLDTRGVILKRVRISDHAGCIDISALEKGLYFFLVGGEKIKIVKE